MVGRLADALIKEGMALGLDLRVLEADPGQEPKTFSSMLLAVMGRDITPVLAWEGTVQWIGRSPFRLHHKRKNWYVDVLVLRPPEAPSWRENDIRIEVMRASGPGGQHVNKTESAVRVTHIPTGLQAIAREERSQLQNRRLALARLHILLEDMIQSQKTAARQERWQQHNQLIRGNPVRVYRGEDFQISPPNRGSHP